jgi:hypothetical protein
MSDHEKINKTKINRGELPNASSDTNEKKCLTIRDCMQTLHLLPSCYDRELKDLTLFYNKAVDVNQYIQPFQKAKVVL